MKIHIIGPKRAIDQAHNDSLVLREDLWNDWWEYRTQYHAIYRDPEGRETRLGHIKIAFPGLLPADQDDAPEHPIARGEWPSLPQEYISLGQSKEYYEELATLPLDTRKWILRSLRDVVSDIIPLLRMRHEAVVARSILRSVTMEDIEGEFHRSLEELPEPHSFTLEYRGTSPHMVMGVDHGSKTPSHIHAIIGTNGVGKTTLLKSIAESISRSPGQESRPGEPPVTVRDMDGSEISLSEAYSGLHFVSWSAFDKFSEADSWNIRKDFSLTRITADGVDRLKGTPSNREDRPAGVAESLIASLDLIQEADRVHQWQALLASLESDPIFREFQLFDKLQGMAGDGREKLVEELLTNGLSDGHRVVLLTVTNLVATVDEFGLVLMDEPEAHLHPPLLAALLGCLGRLLRRYNAMAIVSTHSPVVLQEVSRRCSWILERTSDGTNVRHPLMETYGADIAELTHEAFGLQVHDSGFWREMRSLAAAHTQYDAALASVEGRIGSLAKVALHSLIYSQEAGEPS